MKIGVVVGASGHSEDSTVTTMSPIPSSDASTNSNSDPLSVDLAHNADAGGSPVNSQSS